MGDFHDLLVRGFQQPLGLIYSLRPDILVDSHAALSLEKSAKIGFVKVREFAQLSESDFLVYIVDDISLYLDDVDAVVLERHIVYGVAITVNHKFHHPKQSISGIRPLNL